MPVVALQHLRRMRGGAQSQLVRASDGHLYVVKLTNNPQHIRILANELLGTMLAERLGLPVAPAEVVRVDPWLIESSPDMTVQLAKRNVSCAPGLHFGSRYVLEPRQGQVLDILPQAMWRRVTNLRAFAGALVFDKWTCNTDFRQAVFSRRWAARTYSVSFIDQGHCFDGASWSFPDSPLRGCFAFGPEVYSPVQGWNSFEPWLSRVEAMSASDIWECAGAIPLEWCGDHVAELGSVVAALLRRRQQLRDLIAAFRDSSIRPFPNWKTSVGTRFARCAPACA